MGHYSASQSLRQRLLEADGAARAEVVDLLAYAMPGASEAMYKCFAFMVTHGSGLYNTYYKFTENKEEAKPPFEGLLLEKLGQLLDEAEPDLVIATHPLCAQLMSRWKEETGSGLTLVTCITDLSAHSEWITGGTDCYLAGAPEVAEELAEKGVEPERIVCAGIPVSPAFGRIRARRGGETRRLLIMGGGLGLLPKKDRFYEALNALEGVETTIIAGNNKKLYDRLVGKYEHIEVVGYTKRVYEYMARADLMLSKPGGITLFESIYSELPLLAWEPFLEQEKHNARCLVRRGMGAIAGKEWEECLDAVRGLLYNDGALRWMRGNMRRFKGQLAQERLGGLLEELAGVKEEKAG